MASPPGSPGRSVRFSSKDGLSLHACCYDAPGSTRPPVLCLAGLTRNSRDFHDIAMALSTGPEARTVWALDSRGRGLSDHDPNWKNYNVLTEAQDVIEMATVAGLHGATIIGTSRGGLLAMVIAAMQPTIIGAVVMNDIGPVIERDGLIRIAGYVGRMPLPATWADAAQTIAEMSRRHFPDVPMAQWEEVARAWYSDKGGRPAPGFDRRIGKAVSATGVVIPALWPQFKGLANVPLLVVRGENSDILSQRTVDEMLAQHPDAAALTVPRQGHAPLLKDTYSIGAIARFTAAAERGEKVAGRDFGAPSRG